MLGLQELFDKQIAEQLTPEILLPRVICSKLEKLNITLTPEQTEKLKAQFADLKSFSFKLNIEDDQVAASGFASEQALEAILKDTFKDLADDAKKAAEQLVEEFPNIIEKTSKGIADQLFEELMQ